MKRYTVTIKMTVKAPDRGTAHDIGANASEHLFETFNDDGSIEPPMVVETTKKGQIAHSALTPLERSLLALPVDTVVKLHLSSGSVVSGKINERDSDSVLALYVQLDDRRIEHTLIPLAQIVAFSTYTE